MTFERYIDSFKYRWMQPPTPEPIFADAAYYRNWSPPIFAHLCFVIMAREWHTPYPNYFLFARAAWDPSQDPDALLADFCSRWFGRAGGDMLKYYRILVDVFSMALVSCGYSGSKGGSLLSQPLDTTEPFAMEHVAAIDGAIERLPECRAHLDKAIRTAGHDEELLARLGREANILRITEIELASLRSAVLGTHLRAKYLAEGKEEDGRAALGALRNTLSSEMEYRDFIRGIGLNDEPNWLFDWVYNEIQDRANDIADPRRGK
jgi:hypothetical protein